MGGGPGGAACAHWLAEAGHEVVLVERKSYPRVKTCGDGLTPRAVRQLADIGLSGALAGHHRIDGLRSIAFGKTLELPWPAVPGLPDHGYVVTRHDLDQLVAERAQKSGAELWTATEATQAVRDDSGAVTGAVVRRKTGPGPGDWGEAEKVEARYVVVADGATSRFGWSLGTARDRDQPVGMAIRTYYTSERHDDPYIEAHLDIRDAEGRLLPGYGWVFPVGDGRVNVGVGLLSTFSDWKSVNTSRLMDAFVAQAPASWGIRPETCCAPPTGGKLPLGLSVAPRYGQGWLAVGDAIGVINPFNGEGIAYAYETGRYAAEALDLALAGQGHGALVDYDSRLQDVYGLYYRVGQAFVTAIGRPWVMRGMLETGMRSATIMEWVMRIMANMLRPDQLGPAEAAYKALTGLARISPARS